MLYDNHGRTLEGVDLVNDFYRLEPVDSLAKMYDISEEQVFEVVGGTAVADTRNSCYVFDFGSTPPTVTRCPGVWAGALPGDFHPLPLVSIGQWKPYLVMLLILPGNEHATTRVTSGVERVEFSG